MTQLISIDFSGTLTTDFNMQWGMAATSGGLGFAGVSRIYRTGLQVTRFA